MKIKLNRWYRMAGNKYIDNDIQQKYEYYDYGHALEILHECFPAEWREIQDSLRKLKLTSDDITKSGGKRITYPKKV